MRKIKRLPEPQILIDKKQEWLDKLLASGEKRPDSSKYAHIQVKIQLRLTKIILKAIQLTEKYRACS